ncbi:hypothetical protein [Caballeronia zhejiangensis]|uniref:hypothetical protein n=1 Tax=Caballeronia zhejiangensis TaxID=871203 RepID=UPI001EF443F1|nr:hypothetical protein [Caballeronia zhejiangensis]MCG7400299.1 hypothetical protein [Caballeronia zhejiangensis]
MRSGARPTWLITGCSSDLCHHLAEAVLARGWNAVVTARNPAKLQGMVAAYPDTALALPLDVIFGAEIAEAVLQAESRRRD